jgi:hypothetical protein
MLMVLVSAVILRYDSRGTSDHILLSHIRGSPNLEGEVVVFISPRKRVAQLYPLSEPYVTTDGQSASLSSNKAPIWGLRPDFYYCQTVAGLLMWGALCDERTGLSFTIAAGPRRRSHSRVRVPWDSRPYFTVSDSRLPFLSPPSTRRARVEIFDPASTRDSQSQSYIATDGRSISKSWCRAPSGAHDQIFIIVFDSYGLVFLGRPL